MREEDSHRIVIQMIPADWMYRYRAKIEFFEDRVGVSLEVNGVRMPMVEAGTLEGAFRKAMQGVKRWLRETP